MKISHFSWPVEWGSMGKPLLGLSMMAEANFFLLFYLYCKAILLKCLNGHLIHSTIARNLIG
jgi:hypothetical protein